MENRHNNDETRREKEKTIVFIIGFWFFIRVFPSASDLPVLSYPIDHRFAPPTTDA